MRCFKVLTYVYMSLKILLSHQFSQVLPLCSVLLGMVQALTAKEMRKHSA